jgi:hypothetical protein
MRKLALIHFNPIELYPPIMNWLSYLADHTCGNIEVHVFTTHATSIAQQFTAPSSFIKIIRIGGIPQDSSLKRYGTYFRFYTSTFLRMAAWYPDTVLYYETISSFPALAYKSWIRRKSHLFIHYHEYTSPEEYESGMVLNRWFHQWEKRLYPLSSWISHTNGVRMQEFIKDSGGVSLPHTYILPNYPPGGWVLTTARYAGNPLKVIYVGSLSIEAMYVKEFAEWVLQQNGRVIWDIYCVNISDQTKEYLESLDKNLIRFKGSCDYYELPSILPLYDVGIVLYKGVIRNHIIAVSNKVFEYLSNGLDVWYSQEMEGTHPYITAGTFPKVLPIDCRLLDHFDLENALDRTGLEFLPSVYSYEKVFSSLLNKMISE